MKGKCWSFRDEKISTTLLVKLKTVITNCYMFASIRRASSSPSTSRLTGLRLSIGGSVESTVNFSRKPITPIIWKQPGSHLVECSIHMQNSCYSNENTSPPLAGNTFLTDWHGRFLIKLTGPILRTSKRSRRISWRPKSRKKKKRQPSYVESKEPWSMRPNARTRLTTLRLTGTRLKMSAVRWPQLNAPFWNTKPWMLMSFRANYTGKKIRSSNSDSAKSASKTPDSITGSLRALLKCSLASMVSVSSICWCTLHIQRIKIFWHMKTRTPKPWPVPFKKVMRWGLFAISVRC